MADILLALGAYGYDVCAGPLHKLTSCTVNEQDPVVEPHDDYPVGDALEIARDYARPVVLTELGFGKMPEIMIRILNEGGLTAYIKKYKDFTCIIIVSRIIIRN